MSNESPVVIIDLGDPQESARPKPERNNSISSFRRISTTRWKQLPLLTASLFVLLGFASDGLFGVESESSTFKRPSACAAVSELKQRIDESKISSDKDPYAPLTVSNGPSYVTVAAVDPETGKDTPYALVGPEGLWEFCATEEQLSRIEPGLVTGEERFGSLPAGMTYIYAQDQQNLEFSAVGIRLQNGAVLNRVFNRDGSLVLPE